MNPPARRAFVAALFVVTLGASALGASSSVAWAMDPPPIATMDHASATAAVIPHVVFSRYIRTSSGMLLCMAAPGAENATIRSGDVFTVVWNTINPLAGLRARELIIVDSPVRSDPEARGDIVVDPPIRSDQASLEILSIPNNTLSGPSGSLRAKMQVLTVKQTGRVVRLRLTMSIGPRFAPIDVGVIESGPITLLDAAPLT